MKVPPLRSGLLGLFTQNLILMGVFFTVPLYLQLVLGLDALETGIKMLPVSIAMFTASAVGSRLTNRYPVRSIVRAGLITTVVAVLALLATIEPDLDEGSFAIAMALLDQWTHVSMWYGPDGEIAEEEMAQLYADMALRAIGARP